MNRALLALAPGLLVIVVAVAIVARPASSVPRIYTVAQVRAGLARDPRAWAGRAILIHGIIMRCLDVEGCTTVPAGIPSLGLVDGIPISDMPRTTVLSQSLPLAMEHDPLRRVSWLRPLLPAPQTLSLTQPATYRVRLVVMAPCAVENTTTSCVVALLTDAV